MKAIDTIIGVGWIVFWAYWLVMASSRTSCDLRGQR